MSEENLQKAVLVEPTRDGKKVRCHLCSFRCLISPGEVGHCMVRKNIDGVLYSLNFDKLCAANSDPIEKKPLFHFQPGSQSFSIACVGCNFRCEFCQNWQISQMPLDNNKIEGYKLSPEQIVQTALQDNCKSIAYTYTEPTIFMELCEQCGRLAKQQGLKNVFVSNGYQTPEAIDFAAPWLDAINIDLKAFSDSYYRKLCKARLQPVLDTISYVAKQTDIWLEVTTLIVPGENDSDDELKQIADFLVSNAGPDVPWHISRFYPAYHLDGKPQTPIKTLERAQQIGKAAGLRYIYLGNVPGEKYESTFCYKCNSLLIERFGYRILKNNIKNNCCPDCQTEIAGRWN